MMKKSISVLAVASLLVSPAIAAPQANADRMRQLSEVVFKHYPPGALARGEQGAVYFDVTLDKDAHPTSCQVTHGSGHPLLDEETCDLIVKNAVFNSLKDANGRVTKSTHEGVVYWRIPGAPEPSVAPVALTQATTPEKRICKRSVRVGTLAGFERTCLTASEWAQRDEQTRGLWDELQGRKGSTSCDTLGVAAANVPFATPSPAAGSGGTC